MFSPYDFPMKSWEWNNVPLELKGWPPMFKGMNSTNSYRNVISPSFFSRKKFTLTPPPPNWTYGPSPKNALNYKTVHFPPQLEKPGQIIPPSPKTTAVSTEAASTCLSFDESELNCLWQLLHDYRLLLLLFLLSPLSPPDLSLFFSSSSCTERRRPTIGTPRSGSVE